MSTASRPHPAGRRARRRAAPVRRPTGLRNRLALPALLAVAGLGLAFALAPPPVAVVAQNAGPAASHDRAQSLHVDGTVPVGVVARDGYAATTGAQTLIAGGTNHDWARLVLTIAGWPTTDSNVAVFTRWMRQENGPDDWWNRNNPLNNGWGSGGGSGLGSYGNLVIAAENCADSLHRNSGYTAIAAGFAASAPEAQIEAAIWASPWASSHYANGAHWSHSPVPQVAAPAAAWR